MFEWLSSLFVDQSEERIARVTSIDFRRSIFVAHLLNTTTLTDLRSVVAALFAELPDLALRIEDEPTVVALVDHRTRVESRKTTPDEAEHLLQWFLAKHQLSAHASVLAERQWNSFPALLSVSVDELIAATRASPHDVVRWHDAMNELRQRYAVAAQSNNAPAVTSGRADVADRLLSSDDDESTSDEMLRGAVGVEVFDLSTAAKQRATFQRELKKKAVAAAATARRVLHDARRRVCAVRDAPSPVGPPAALDLRRGDVAIVLVDDDTDAWLCERVGDNCTGWIDASAVVDLDEDDLTSTTASSNSNSAVSPLQQQRNAFFVSSDVDDKTLSCSVGIVPQGKLFIVQFHGDDRKQYWTSLFDLLARRLLAANLLQFEQR
jgi:hypothetical protein